MRLPAAGFKGLFVTLDVPYLGRRLDEYRNNFGVPKGMEYPNLFPGVDVTNLEDGGDMVAHGRTDLAIYQYNPTLTWLAKQTTQSNGRISCRSSVNTPR